MCCSFILYISSCHKAHKALTFSFHPLWFAAKALTVIHDCHPATRLSSSTILLHVVFGRPGPSLKHGPNIPVSYPCFILRIHNQSCRLSVFLSAFAQKCHPATKNSRRITGVNRGSNAFHFCNKLIFTGVGYQPPAPSPQPPAPSPTPNLEDQGVTLRLVSTLRPVRHGWPYQ